MSATMRRRRLGSCLPMACVALGWLPTVGQAQGLTAFDRDRTQILLDRVRKEIADRYYDPGFNGIDLQAAYDSASARIRSSTTLARALAAVAQFTLDLHDPHTFFIPPQWTVDVTYGWDMAMVSDSCFVLDVAPGSDAERKGLLRGDLVLSVNGLTPTRDNVWQIFYVYRAVRPQPGLNTVVRSPGALPRRLDLLAAVRERRRIIGLTDLGGDIAQLIRDAEKADEELKSVVMEYGDRVLIWKLPTFAISNQDIQDVVKRARSREALVLDLRGNSGGPVQSLIALVGGLNRDSVVLGMQRERHKQTALIAKGTGAKAFTGRLLVLVDSRSGSASEVVARVVQLTQRGHVLGDRTAGAVRRSTFRRLRQGVEIAVFYGVSVTDADLVMTDGGRLERAGVNPDELIIPTASDLAAGADPVLARALALAGEPLGAAEAGSLLRRERR